MTRHSARLLMLALVALWSTGCATGLHFEKVSVLAVAPDPETGSTRVSVTFEVWDDDEQLTDLPHESFSVEEDGRPSPSESLAESGRAQHRVPLVLLLDTSKSMYDAGAVGTLKAAATGFVDVLTEAGFEVTVFRFANEVQETQDIDAIPEEFIESEGRWTSLYAAVDHGLDSNSEAITVVFSDGADSYSQNHGVAGLGAIESSVLPTEEGGNGHTRVVHAIGFGDVASSVDQQGISGVDALERLAYNGSFHFAQDPSALDVVFQDVANRIRNVYVYDYLSPNLQGWHTLVVKVSARDDTAETTPLSYSADEAKRLLDEALAHQEYTSAMADMMGSYFTGDYYQDCVEATVEGWPQWCSLVIQSVNHQDQEMRDIAFQSYPLEYRAALYGACMGEEASEAAHQPACLELEKRGARGPAGLGVTFQVTSKGPVIESVSAGSGAEAAGLAIGDTLLAVDERSLAAFFPLLPTMLLLSGAEGSVVALEVERAGTGVVETVQLTRTLLPAEFEP